MRVKGLLAVVVVVALAAIGSAQTSGLIDVRAVRMARSIFSGGTNGQAWLKNSALPMGGEWGNAGGTPGGSDTQVQFNDGGSFGGSADLTWDNSTFTVTGRASVNFTLDSTTTGSQIGGNSTLAIEGGDHESLYGFGNGVEISSASNVDEIYGNEAFMYVDHASAVVDEMWGYKSNLKTLNGTLNRAIGFGVSFEGGAAVDALFGFWVPALTNEVTTNPYSFWHDEQGVFRIKADNTFDSVYQAIPALYNPQFTKYTPGAANFERCIPGCQWNGNVAEIGNEVGAGGGNALRDLRFIGQDIKPNPTGFVFVHQAVKTAAPDGADCDDAAETNREVFDSTNDNLYICSGASGWRKIATAAP